MKLIKKILYFYSLFFTLTLFVQGLRMVRTTTDLALIILLSAPTLFFTLSIVQLFNQRVFNFEKIRRIAVSLKIISLVNSLFLLFIALIGLLFYFQYLFVFIFLPLPLYFFLSDFDNEAKEEFNQIVEADSREEKRITLPIEEKKIEFKKQKEIVQAPSNAINLEKKEIKDPLRRQFLKVVGASGIGFLITTLLNPKKTEAAFFGSVPGPGTVALKDASGNKVDPAIKQPTDGYKISEIDDSTTSYYGYLDKDSNWYIVKENADGSFRYVRGSGSFASYWNSRDSLSYDYFDNVF